jgi:hypothetical protein
MGFYYGILFFIPWYLYWPFSSFFAFISIYICLRLVFQSSNIFLHGWLTGPPHSPQPEGSGFLLLEEILCCSYRPFCTCAQYSFWLRLWVSPLSGLSGLQYSFDSEQASGLCHEEDYDILIYRSLNIAPLLSFWTSFSYYEICHN